MAAIRDVVNNPNSWFSNEPDGPAQLAADLRERYAGKSAEQIIDDIVELRGFLHHHNEKRPGIWHPDDHRRYEAEAFLRMFVAQEIAFNMTNEVIFGDEVMRELGRRLNRPVAAAGVREAPRGGG